MGSILFDDTLPDVSEGRCSRFEDTVPVIEAMSAGSVKLIDLSVKDALLRYPTADLIRKIFPDAVFRGRSVLCNPLRGERHPSMSCFRDRAGHQRWKDFATGETGDNIDFYRLVYPELNYVDAVDRLSYLVLGRSALQDVNPERGISFMQRPRLKARRRFSEPERPSALQIRVVLPYAPGSAIPESLLTYTRGRGISDEVASRYFCYVRFENTNRTGRVVVDPASGIPLVDGDGEVVRDDGMNDSVAMRNDIGGFSFRVPEGAGHEGFKGTNASFLTTILADGSAPALLVKPFGMDDGRVEVERFSYEEARRRLYVGEKAGFDGVQPYVVPFAMAFLDSWAGRCLEGRELSGVVAVLGAMNGPVNRSVSVVEGMFDGASVMELERMSGRGSAPGRDVVILNSLSNLKWAVPFLAMHGEVRSLLDNDLRSAAGQKAYSVLKESVEAFASRVGVGCRVMSSSGLFRPYKDVNDYLKQAKGFVQPVPRSDGDAAERNPAKDGRKKEKAHCGPRI